MIKKGLFGEVIHCEGGYRHDLRDEVSLGGVNRHYRLRNYMNRNAELYPTHELGPIAKYLDKNRGNRMIMLTAMASKSAGLNTGSRKTRARISKTRTSASPRAMLSRPVSSARTARR